LDSSASRVHGEIFLKRKAYHQEGTASEAVQEKALCTPVVPTEKMSELKTLMTIVGGKVVFELEGAL